METRTAGDLTVSAQGLGCTGTSEFCAAGDVRLPRRPPRLEKAAPVGATAGDRYPDTSTVHR